jgi:hypothetical protein
MIITVAPHQEGNSLGLDPYPAAYRKLYAETE